MPMEQVESKATPVKRTFIEHFFNFMGVVFECLGEIW